MIVPQPVVSTAAAAAVGAAVLVLSAASITNMYEAYSIVRRQQRQPPLPSPPEAASKAGCWKSIDEALEGLSGMNKGELVELFLRCEPPSESDLAFGADDGEPEEDWRYDGYLLSNGPILTPVTNFITNRLFGRGSRWLGKAYVKPSFDSNGRVGIGRNRFLGRGEGSGSRRRTTPSSNAKSAVVAPNSNAEADEFLDRTFEYSVGQSWFPSPLSSRSLFNRYAPHCPVRTPMSLIWRGMVDELRVIEINNKEEGGDAQKDKDGMATLMLGMGYFTWSGGAWNAAPFCLVARRCHHEGGR